MTEQAEITAAGEGAREARAALFEFFSLLFGGPRTPEFLAAWPDAFRSAAAFAEAAGSPGTVPEAEATPEPLALERELALLLYGVGPVTVPLSESAYTNDAWLRCQAPMQTLAEIYRRHGFSLTEEAERDADALPAVFAFAAKLIRAKDPEEPLFIASHAAPLGLAVADAVSHAPKAPLLQAAARAMQGFIAFEKAFTGL